MISKSNGKYYHNGVEISANEYEALFTEIKEKAAWVDNVCKGTASIDEVPTEWREDIQRRVEERQAVDDDPELTEAEVLEIILGGAI